MTINGVIGRRGWSGFCLYHMGRMLGVPQNCREINLPLIHYYVFAQCDRFGWFGGMGLRPSEIDIIFARNGGLIDIQPASDTQYERHMLVSRVDVPENVVQLAHFEDLVHPAKYGVAFSRGFTDCNIHFSRSQYRENWAVIMVDSECDKAILDMIAPEHVYVELTHLA